MTDTLEIDDQDISQASKNAADFGTDRYGYVVTPNVDHVIRHHRDRQFRLIYADADFVLLDSRLLAHLLLILKRQRFHVCTGSDLTAALFQRAINPNDVMLLVGASKAQADRLRSQFHLTSLHHVEPPMNFIRDPAAVEQCLRDIEAVGPFRFCFLAVGSPQQELIAHALKERGRARGLALCIGASINFLTGIERRAPAWMQHSGLEWLYRLLKNPRRLATRYLVRGPAIFPLLFRVEFRARRRTAADISGTR